MDKKEAIEFLKQALSEVPHLRELKWGNQVFKLWSDGISDVLESSFGLKSSEHNKFNLARSSTRNFNALEEEYQNELNMKETAIKSIIQKAKLLGIEEKSAAIEVAPESIFREIPPKAFIAHGGKSGVLNKLLDFIRALGIEPIVVELLASRTMSVDDKVKKYMQEADCGIVLATRSGIVDKNSKREKQHPRLNVIDEFERLRAIFPDRTILLLEQGVELPSNIAGITHEPFARQSMDTAFTSIVRELADMGILKAVKPPRE